MTSDENSRDADLVAVWAGNPVAAEVVRAVLGENDIDSIVAPRIGGKIIPDFVAEEVEVRVNAENAERAREAIAESRAAGAKMRALFVCTHNQFRSQMAEGWLRALGGEHFEVFSAGTNPQGPSPIAVKIMREVGVDISGQSGNHVDEFLDQNVDVVITVCDDANEKCPTFSAAARREHWSFGDPSKFLGTDAEIAEKMRGVRDQIKGRVETFVAELTEKN